MIVQKELRNQKTAFSKPCSASLGGVQGDTDELLLDDKECQGDAYRPQKGIVAACDSVKSQERWMVEATKDWTQG
jgi:hypothetical protein